MDRDTLLDLLVRAEQHLVFGKRQIDNQYRVIAKLESEGHDTAAAVELLKEFVEAQELYERDRDRLMTKPATAS
jgi:hypothetical protein